MKKPKPVKAYGVLKGGRLIPLARGSAFMLKALDFSLHPEEIRKKCKIVRVKISLA